MGVAFFMSIGGHVANQHRRGVGRAELMVGIAVVALIALVAVPLGSNMAKKSKRNELLENVNSIRIVVMAHHDAFQEYVGATPAPRSPFEVNSTAVPWIPSEGFKKLSWAPEEPTVRGSYSISVSESGFKIVGTSDIDEDAERAVVEASETSLAKLVSDDSVY